MTILLYGVLHVLAVIARGAALIVAVELLLVLAWCLWVTWRDRGGVDARVPTTRPSIPESGDAHANVAHLDWDIPAWVNNATATPIPGRPACPVVALDDHRRRPPRGDAA